MRIALSALTALVDSIKSLLVSAGAARARNRGRDSLAEVSLAQRGKLQYAFSFTSLVHDRRVSLAQQMETAASSRLD
jgi:hypothetical protein